MINILLEEHDIDNDYLYNDLNKYIMLNHTVAAVLFSFKDSEVKSLSDWNTLYSKENGKYYNGIVNSLNSYGISEEQISFINYFTDTKESAQQKIKNADIVYFPGGLPDRMMDRIKEFDLLDVLMKHNGIVLGYSAGALIQLAEYHISPDKYYDKFEYCKGIPYLDNFYLEVHYDNTENQNKSIQKVIAERGKTVYAPVFMSGGIIVDNGNIKLLGDVKVFTK